jgi:pimeloyl-ACP methyl ester carboxylesterase
MNRGLAILVLACAVAGAAEPAPDASHAISVQEIGQGDPIMFLPGLGCRGEVWDRVVKLLPGHRAALASIAGFGGEPGRQTNFANVQKAVVRYVRAKHWSHVTLVAHSFSGSLAIPLAAAEPELFSKVIILDAYPFSVALMKPGISAEDARKLASVVRQMVAGMSDDQFRAQQQEAFGMMITADPDRAKALSWMLGSDRSTLAEAQFEALSGDLRPQVHQIRQPLLVLGSWRGREKLSRCDCGRKTGLPETGPARSGFAGQFPKCPHIGSLKANLRSLTCE